MLTQRELQVLYLVAEGKSDPQIGRELFVTADTVKTFLRSIYRKLDALNRTHAVAIAIRSNLI